MQVLRSTLFSMGFTERKKQEFVLFRDELSYDKKLGRSVRKPKYVGKILLDKQGNVLQCEGVKVSNGIVSAYARIDRA